MTILHRSEMILVAMLLATLMPLVASVVEALSADGRPGAEPPWTAPLRAADAALAAKNPSLASRELRSAYLAALATRQWEGLMAVGDATRRAGEVSGSPRDAVPRARQAYRTALLRARAQGSLEGVLRATEAFAALGDRAVAEQGLRVAHELARRQRDTQALARIHALADRLAERPLAAGDLRVE